MDLTGVYNLKFKTLLDRLLHSRLQIKDDRNMNILLSRLSGKDNADLGETLLDLPIFMEWVEKAIDFLETSQVPMFNDKLTSFVLNLTALLIKMENRFYQLNCKNYILRLYDVIKFQSPLEPCNKVAFLKLLTNLTLHEAGYCWLIESELWQKGVSLCITLETVYVQKESYNFVYNLLKNSLKFRESFASVAVSYVASGIKYNNSKREILATVKLISFLLESLIKEKNFTKEMSLAKIVVKEHDLEQTLSELLTSSTDQELLIELRKILIAIYHLTPLFEKTTEKIELNQVKVLYDKTLNLLTNQLSTNHFESMSHLLFVGVMYWNIINPLLPSLDDLKSNKCNLALLYNMFHTVPNYFICVHVCSMSREMNEDDEIKELFYDDAVISLCEKSLRLLYRIRDTCAQDEKKLFETAYKFALNVERCQKYYMKSEATMCFRCLCHAYKDIITSVKAKPAIIVKFYPNEKYLSALCHIITKFLTSFDISWTDAFEGLFLIESCMDYLNEMIWSTKITVECLRMLKILLWKNMTPSMVLLSDRAHDTPLVSIPSILYTKLHDPNWELRDSSLEVFQTLAVIAQNKFPSFQHIILNADLINLAITICTEDGESFVRASALKCLQELVKIQQIWNEVLAKENLPTKVISILDNETEAIVRSEAATLMKVIYREHSIEGALLDQVFLAMYRAATCDLNHDVQTHSIDFWGVVICKQLVNEGMIDGAFPSFTFSRENRKIVTLTAPEIRSRLQKVLRYLSRCGCLSVLIKTLSSRCDLTVNIKSLEVTKKIATILREHDITSTTKEQNVTSPLRNNQVSDQIDKVEISEEIIREIVDSDDSFLLSNIVINDRNGRREETVLQNIEEVSIEDFLKFIEKNWEGIISERRRWLDKMDDLNSLLDDMLKNYDEFSEVNVMDCY